MSDLCSESETKEVLFALGLFCPSLIIRIDVTCWPTCLCLMVRLFPLSFFLFYLCLCLFQPSIVSIDRLVSGYPDWPVHSMRNLCVCVLCQPAIVCVMLAQSLCVASVPIGHHHHHTPWDRKEENSWPILVNGQAVNCNHHIQNIKWWNELVSTSQFVCRCRCRMSNKQASNHHHHHINTCSYVYCPLKLNCALFHPLPGSQFPPFLPSLLSIFFHLLHSKFDRLPTEAKSTSTTVNSLSLSFLHTFSHLLCEANRSDSFGAPSLMSRQSSYLLACVCVCVLSLPIHGAKMASEHWGATFGMLMCELVYMQTRFAWLVPIMWRAICSLYLKDHPYTRAEH